MFYLQVNWFVLLTTNSVALALFLCQGNVPILVILMVTVSMENVIAFLDFMVMIVVKVSSRILLYYII